MTRRIGAAAVPQAGTGLARAAARQLAGVAAALVVMAIFAERVRGIDTGAVLATLGRVAPAQWLAALILTALSFWAVGRYDALIHRHIGTGTGTRTARRAGACAIAISQATGFGLVTGALVRWRMLPGITPWQAMRLTAVVAATFLAGWAMVTACAVLVSPNPATAPLRPLAGLALGLGLVAIVGASLAPPASAVARRLALPGLATLAAILGLAALDTTAAGLALWAVLPAGADPGWPVLLPAFLAALGAGLVLSTPGGIGPFELALLTLLPAVPQTDLLAGVLAWRAIYFALPAVLAAIALARGPRPEPAAGSPPAGDLAGLVARAPRAETGLLQLGEHRLLASGCAQGALLVGETRQTLTALFDPIGDAATHDALLDRLSAAARDRGRMPCLYKLSPRAAAGVRRSGWSVIPIAEEAVLDLAGFDLAGPSRAGLRRKLRRAAAAGVTVTGDDPLPIAEMAAVAAGWVRDRGGERGFSMGRFAPGYLAGQRVLRAEAGGRLLAFASFHTGQAEWTLDLLRHGAEIPDGTMQALICAAAEAARAAGATRLSLAAVTAHAALASGLPAPLRRHAARRDADCGLRRFKAGFAPRWERRYLAAPHRAGLALAAADLALHIRAPAPLPGSRSL